MVIKVDENLSTVTQNTAWASKWWIGFTSRSGAHVSITWPLLRGHNHGDTHAEDRAVSRSWWSVWVSASHYWLIAQDLIQHGKSPLLTLQWHSNTVKKVGLSACDHNTSAFVEPIILYFPKCLHWEVEPMLLSYTERKKKSNLCWLYSQRNCPPLSTLPDAAVQFIHVWVWHIFSTTNRVTSQC